MALVHHRAMRFAAFLGLVSISVGVIGCGGSDSAGKGELPPPQVTVAPPIQLTVTHYEFATGRTEPLEQIEVRARVSGYLKSIKFKPGSEVQKGDVLFEIDREPFDADLAKANANEKIAEADKGVAEGQLQTADARLVFTKGEFKRQEDQFKKGGGSQKDFDKAKSDFDEADASVKTSKSRIEQAVGKIAEAKSEVARANLNVGYCTIKAEITGLIGDKLVDVGNLVTMNQTMLTTIIAVERMDVGFDVDEGTIQRIQLAIREKRIVLGKRRVSLFGIPLMIADEVPAEAGLAIHGTNYPLKGKINFQDNKLDSKTGTMRMKARFDNPQTNDRRMLSAGMYARIRVPIGAPTESVLVDDVAFGSDQGTRFLYLIGPEKKAIRVSAVTGELVDDPSGKQRKLRVVETVTEPGQPARKLTEKDSIIVGGIQRVRPGMTVDPVPQKQ